MRQTVCAPNSQEWRLWPLKVACTMVRMETNPTELLAQATLKQRSAADSQASVWVAASAGTGKTKVLTDRVLTLLLAGTLPQRILCLTFTKAAAAEMANRIAKRLAGWATASEEKLAEQLEDLLGHPAEQAVIIRARRLFAQVLDVPGGMHMETIHAFCQSLLRRFPLEADLAPHFQVMDERDAGELLESAKEEVLAAARDGWDNSLAGALAEITARIHETGFPDLMAELAGDRGRLKRLLIRKGGPQGVIASLRQRLDLEPEDTVQSLLAQACDDESFDAPALRQAAVALMGGTKTDAERGGLMEAWLADPAGRVASFGNWRRAFLTDKSEIRAKLVTNGIRNAHPGMEDTLVDEAHRVADLVDQMRAAQAPLFPSKVKG